MRDLVRVACNVGVIEKAASWYSFGEISLGQGEGAATCILEMNPELAKLVLDQLMEGA